MYSNVKDFGAIGNGIVDDTEAIKKAMQNAVEETGVVYFPPGIYMSKSLDVPSHITLEGAGGWSYSAVRTTTRYGTREDKGYKGQSVIAAIDGEGRGLIDLHGKCGTRILKLTLDGRGMGENYHGVYMRNQGVEQNICVEDCRIEKFSGSAIRLDRGWVFSIRRNLFMFNNGHGIDCSGGYDGWIIDNQICGNKGSGIYAWEGEIIPGAPETSEPIFTGMASVMVTANRIEWNTEAGIKIKLSNTMQITGNSIDHNLGPGLHFVCCVSSTVTGNVLRSSGVDTTEDLSTQIYMEDCRGVSVVGNSFWGWYQRYRLTSVAPFYNFILKNNCDCSIMGNTSFEGCGLKAILDLGGNSNTDISFNPVSYPDAEKYGLPKPQGLQ